MDGGSVTEALAWLCRLIDEGRPRGVVPRLLLGGPLLAVLGAAACAGAQGHPPPPADDRVEVVGTDELAGPVELVMDGLDNDGDGLVDCSDPDCASMVACLATEKENVPMYGVPSEPIESADPVPCR